MTLDAAAFGLIWSPDGETIGYLTGVSVCGPCPSPPPPPAGIWLVNADGTGQRQLTANAFSFGLAPISTWDTPVPAVWQPQ